MTSDKGSEITSNFFSTLSLKKKIDIRDIKHGVPNRFNDNMTNIMQNKYLRDSMERKMTQKIIQDDMSRSYMNFPSTLKAGVFNDSPLSSASYHKKNLHKNLGLDDANRSLS